MPSEETASRNEKHRAFSFTTVLDTATVTVYTDRGRLSMFGAAIKGRLCSIE
jgi:hypothetical protein